MAKAKLYTTGKGRLKYPRINGKPDTKFDTDGVWKTQLTCDLGNPKTEAVMAAIREAAAKAVVDEQAKQTEAGKKVKVKAADLPYTIDEENNTVEFRSKLKVKGENKKTGETWTNKVAVFDNMGKPLPETTKIGAGTTAQISVEIRSFYTPASKEAGVSLRLKAVKCFNIVEWGQDAGAFGFDNDDEDEVSETVGSATAADDGETDEDVDSDF